MSHIFRAFCAAGESRCAPDDHEGQVTQAVYIFTNMLRKLLQDEQPKYIAAIFESKEKTFRHEAFTEYKPTASKCPRTWPQLPTSSVSAKPNIPMISVTGYEADDVIGTLAVQAANRGLQAVIVSNDKDMCRTGARSAGRLHATEFAGGQEKGARAAD
jgi:DNA polymerase-1